MCILLLKYFKNNNPKLKMLVPTLRKFKTFNLTCFNLFLYPFFINRDSESWYCVERVCVCPCVNKPKSGSDDMDHRVSG